MGCGRFFNGPAGREIGAGFRQRGIQFAFAQIEDKIHTMMLAPLGHAELPRLETKAAPEFQEESLEVIQQG